MTNFSSYMEINHWSLWDKYEAEIGLVWVEEQYFLNGGS